MKDRDKLLSIAAAQKNGLGGQLLGDQPQPLVTFHVVKTAENEIGMQLQSHSSAMHPAEAELILLKAALRFLLR